MFNLHHPLCPFKMKRIPEHNNKNGDKEKTQTQHNQLSFLLGYSFTSGFDFFVDGLIESCYSTFHGLNVLQFECQCSPLPQNSPW